MLWLLALLIIIGVVGYLRSSLNHASWAIGAWLVVTAFSGALFSWLLVIWVPVLLIITLINIPSLRQSLISKPAMKLLKANLPTISKTEQEALDGGNVWWDAELFSGKPDWTRLRDLSSSVLSKEEQEFLDGPVETLCGMLDDWKITHELQDLPTEVWDYIKENRFFGMIIPKEYGGLGFSAHAHSQVVMKVSGRSITAAVTIMVPNSLGPGELLMKYGNKDQKDFYLPRLAVGKDIPCFALTGPEAGSDAGSIPDIGIVCKQEFNGEKDVLGIRLNWEKRYITLSPVATLLGLAFQLYDPDELLSDDIERDGDHIGITVALIPTNTPGIDIGKRHFPLNSPFMNGPNWGKDVFIPMDWLIGGVENVGKGWRMLVECLGEGRGISLPAQSTGAAKLVSRYTGAYARVRRQFGLPIGLFEGVEEPLAEILGNTYIMDGARKLTTTALDQGQRPAVVTALLKYQLTERMRVVINNAMDIQGGSGICLGPSNLLGRGYQAVPIAITVEGANILTRTLIVFGQGAIRCHPYLLDIMKATQEDDLKTLDEKLFSHIGFVVSNLSRSVWFGLTNAIFEVPGTPLTRQYYRRLTRLSAGFALLSDYALLTLGGSLKRKERLSGRFADILANMYLCSAALKHFEDQGEPEADLPLLHYACQSTMHDAQQAMLAVFYNLPISPIAKTLRALMFPFGKPYSPPSDKLIHEVAQLALSPSATRDRLTEGCYLTDDPNDPAGRIEHAFNLAIKAEALESKFKKLMKEDKLSSRTHEERMQEAVDKELLTEAEGKQLHELWLATREAIRVDHFTTKELNRA
ncbi:acyl-CoA dehydrogenase [Cocleimonas sp. KMM 6892]|jgi:acyl-CoA dehydrogenase|uniref:acyl-CoA dehydrogenase n=1 Tax=unclassified Cocleimonas TaxID=2639732 RepID=UPI002DBA9E50|nr:MULTISPECIES: acyl-CoA dehydrogenase [unclassified Cocleimonas]MEB8434156.1 acyl-CoA dehydrogenase [Cocleimonas sp. KMM 6892]MEC4716984.1 acyl-CoA dehydrogenase [Cocleimonas sp. KMM 6895]MEC4746428.1 acyl-CoA dehydrogenase [Cocleimonas sp. KMM 6896]